MRTLETEVLFDLLGRRWSLFPSLTLGVVGYAAGHAALALATGAVAQTLSSPALEQSLLEHLFGGFTTLGGGPVSLVTVSYVGLGSAVVKAGSGAVLAHSEAQIGAIVTNRLRLSMVRALLRDGHELPAPRVLAALSVRLREIEAGVTNGVVTFARACVQLVPLAASLLWLSPKLAGLSLIAVAPFGVAVASLRSRARRQSERAQREREDLEGGVDELVRHSDLFRSYGSGDRALEAVRVAGDAAAASAARVEWLRAALSGGNEVMAAVAVTVALIVAERLGVLAQAAVLLPFCAVFFMAYRPLRDLGDARGWVARGNVALEAVRHATAAHGQVQAVDSPAPRRSSPAPHVWQGRPPPRLELRALGARDRGPSCTAHVPAGSIACLSAPTGTGKTTLLRVLLGLEPSRGCLTVDGIDVSREPAGPGARPFAWVPQEAPLITATIAQNVTLLTGDPSGAPEVLRMMGAERLAVRSHDEVVGPSGVALSGGERRQISVARALSTGLPVLLLDEPTEGLDAESARAVCEALRGLRGKRTIVIATHRPEVVAIADQVLRLDTADDIAAE